MFKVKNPEEESDSAVTHNNNYSSVAQEEEFELEDDFDLEEEFDDEDDFEEEDEDDFEEEDEDDFEEEVDEESGDVFEEFTQKVQSLLDEGAMALEIAEEKTALLEEIDSNSRDYSRLVEEIKVAQADARQNFDDAEFLIKRANEILENNAN
jgi:hypothetical protein